MPKIPVIFCFDDRILLGAGVTILSMLDSANAATDYDIHIFNPGFMVMNLALMRQNAAVKRYFDTIEQFKERLKFFDLDLLNIATPKIAAVPFDYVVLEDVYETEDVTQAKDYSYLKSIYTATDLTAARDATAIVHVAGPRGKPWQRQDVPAYYTAVAKRLPKGLRKVKFRDWRKKWLSKKGRATLVTRPQNQ